MGRFKGYGRMTRERRWLYLGFALLFIGTSSLLISLSTEILDIRAGRIAYAEEGERIVIIEGVYLHASSLFEQYKLSVYVTPNVYVTPITMKFIGNIEVYQDPGQVVHSVYFDYNCSTGLLIQIPQFGVYTIRVEIPEEYWIERPEYDVHGITTLYFYRYWRPFLIIGPILMATGSAIVIGVLIIKRRQVHVRI